MLPGSVNGRNSRSAQLSHVLSAQGTHQASSPMCSVPRALIKPCTECGLQVAHTRIHAYTCMRMHVHMH